MNQNQPSEENNGTFDAAGSQNNGPSKVETSSAVHPRDTSLQDESNSCRQHENSRYNASSTKVVQNNDIHNSSLNDDESQIKESSILVDSIAAAKAERQDVQQEPPPPPAAAAAAAAANKEMKVKESSPNKSYKGSIRPSNGTSDKAKKELVDKKLRSRKSYERAIRASERTARDASKHTSDKVKKASIDTSAYNENDSEVKMEAESKFSKFQQFKEAVDQDLLQNSSNDYDSLSADEKLLHPRIVHLSPEYVSDSSKPISYGESGMRSVDEELCHLGAAHVSPEYGSNTVESISDGESGVQSVSSRVSSNKREEEYTSYEGPCIIAHLVTEPEETERGDGEGEVFMAEEVYPFMQSTKICGLSRKYFWFVLLLTVLIIIGGYICIDRVVLRQGTHSMPTSKPSPPPTEAKGKSQVYDRPVLQSVKERGVIRCYSTFNQNMGTDLCVAIAAAIFNDPIKAIDHVHVIDMPFGEQFAALWNGTIDISAHFTTYNMERNVFESSTGLGIAFSTPFLYSGMIFAGIPEFVDCADRHDTLNGVCRSLSVCVQMGTIHVDVAKVLLPGVDVHETPLSSMVEMFTNGTCNVYITDQVLNIWKDELREAGYDGNYTRGIKLHSKEPLAMTSKGDDQEWADFCNWILQALITAEAFDLTQEVALSSSLWSLSTSSIKDNLFPETTSVFGDDYENMFRNAIAAVGNYGEIYDRHIEFIIPRDGTGRINNLNYGQSGLLHADLFGTLTVDDSKLSLLNLPRPALMPGGTLESIVNRDILRCGVIGNRTMFASLQVEVGDKETQMVDDNTKWTGIDIEYCRAISAAIFPDRFFSLTDRKDSVVFVDVGSNVEDGYIALNNEDIDVLVGGSISLMADVNETFTGKGYTFTPPYFYYDENDNYFTNNHSIMDKTGSTNRGLGRSLVTRDTDPQWSSFVRWITTAIIYAEERGITQESALEMPVVELFGFEFLQMFRDAILAVGNYDDIFYRTLKEPYNMTRKGRNSLNTDGGPQMIPLPLL